LQSYNIFKGDKMNKENLDLNVTDEADNALPALLIEVTGQVTTSNLASFKEIALGAIRRVNKDLSTDEDFVNAEASVKWCSDVESRLAAAKENALSQTASIDALFKTIDDISAEARRVRLDLDKLIKARKEAIRTEIVNAAKAKFDDHIRSLDSILGEKLMPAIYPPIAEAIKGKKTVSSIQDAADNVLAAAKIEANDIQQRIFLNLKEMKEKNEFSFLFADIKQLVLKQPDDFAAVISQRITQHQENEKQKEKERLEREERRKVEEEAKAKKAAEMQTEKVLPIKQFCELPAVETNGFMCIKKPEEDKELTINNRLYSIDEICSCLGFTVMREFLSGLGFDPVDNSTLYRGQDFFSICQALIRHINKVAKKNF
jgi:hypothetical protein